MDTNANATIKQAVEWQPPPFDVQKRIEELRSFLDPKHPWYIKEQETNIKAAIKLYEEGKIDGVNTVYLHDGKIISEKESYTTPWCAMEGGYHYQCAQKQTYGHGALGPNHHEVRKKEYSLFEYLI